MTDKKDTKRIQFDFSPEAFERLEKIAKIMDATSKAEVIRRSLRLQEFLIDKQQEGYNVCLKKGNDVLILPIM